MKLTRFILMAAGSVLLGSGCRKEAPPSDPAGGASSASILPGSRDDLAARIHWLGRKRLDAETNASGFMRIWNEPESAVLERQTLDKLSLAPWRLLRGESGTNATSALLRPLLDDLVQEESYLEIRQSTNQPGALAFAIRLDDARAALWQTNLAAVLESLTGIHPEVIQGSRRGWFLMKHHAPNRLELLRAGGWTIVGAGQGTNALLDDFVARIQRDQVPFAPAATNFWLDAAIDLPLTRAALSLAWNLPNNTPKISLTLSGDGKYVLSQGELQFPRPIPIALEPWTIPTNLIRGLLSSFTAMRGIRPVLSSLTNWNDLRIGPPPNQLYVWAGRVSPLQTLFAVPVPDASNRMAQVSDSLLARVRPWIETNRSGYLEPSKDSDGLIWSQIPFLSPFLRSEQGCILGGFFPDPPGRFGLPHELLQVMDETNLVYYDWELTGARIEAWFQIGQLLRLQLHKAQLLGDSAVLNWLVANEKTLDFSVTSISEMGPGRFSFARKSGTGFTAIEMHLLGDWLESPEFPHGSSTFLGTPDVPLNRKP